MHVLLRLARRNLFRYKSRTLAIPKAVALGITAVLATLSIRDTVEADVRSALELGATKQLPLCLVMSSTLTSRECLVVFLHPRILLSVVP